MKPYNSRPRIWHDFGDFHESIMASGGFGRGARGELRGGLLAARSIPSPTPTTGQTTATPIQTPSIARGTGHAAMQTL